MDVSITTMSRNGQIVIPSEIRKALNIKVSEKFIVFGEGDTIVIKRLSNESLKKEFLELLDTFTFAFERAGITKKDVEEEISQNRLTKRRSSAGGGGH
jgi:AbrB family looped-hinge helix DNA binding protein